MTPSPSPDAPQPSLRWWVLGLLILVALGLLYSLRYVPGLLPWPELSLPAIEPAQDSTSPLPEDYTRPTVRYGEIDARPTPPTPQTPTRAAQPEDDPAGVPTAHPVPQHGQASSAVSRASLEEQIVIGQAAILEALRNLPPVRTVTQATTTSTPAQTTPASQPTGTGQTGQGTGKATPTDARRKKWDFLVKAENGDTAQRRAEEEARRVHTPPREGVTLIHPAKWAIPAQPLKTIYKSMELIGTLRRSINSDLPGLAQCELSIPTFDKFGYSQIILDKGTIAIIRQSTKLEYGQSRIPAKLDQLEPPSGEVILAQADIQDGEGKNGLTGTVNNHYGKLLAAAGINAVLSLGTQSLAGTPGRGEFFQSPAQQAARDISASTSQDIRKITDAQLRVPPTVEVAKGTPCLIQLDENLTFSKAPVVVP